MCVARKPEVRAVCTFHKEGPDPCPEGLFLGTEAQGAGGAGGPPPGSFLPAEQRRPSRHCAPGTGAPTPTWCPDRQLMCLEPENPEGSDGEVLREGRGRPGLPPGDITSHGSLGSSGLSPLRSARPEAMSGGTCVLVSNFWEPPRKPTRLVNGRGAAAVGPAGLLGKSPWRRSQEPCGRTE